jgi:hypothetical protein
VDQNALVSTGHALVKALDAGGLKPRFAMWVHNADTDSWKLWIVPPKMKIEKHDFYMRVARLLKNNRAEVGNLEAADTELIADKHPAMKGLKGFMKVPGFQCIAFSGNQFNGYYLPDGIVLRADL